MSDQSQNHIADTSDDDQKPSDVDIQPDGTPTEADGGKDEGEMERGDRMAAKHSDGNTDAESDSDVASGGSPE